MTPELTSSESQPQRSKGRGRLRWLLRLLVAFGLLLVPVMIIVHRWTQPEQSAGPAPVHEPERVTLSETARRDAGVTVEAARSIVRSTHFEAPGVITLDETRTARIGSLVEGKVVAVTVEVGDRVKAEAALAEIHSEVLHTAWADYRKAVADRKRHEMQFAYTVQAEERAGRLYADKAIPLQEVQKTQVERVVAEQSLEMAKTEVRRAEEALTHLGIAPGAYPSGEKGEQIPVQSPIAGAVLEKLVTAGTAVTPGMPLFVVSDLSTLWALAEVDETQLSLLQVGRPAAIRVAAYPGEVFPGTIIFIGDSLDPKTRRVSVRCRVANPQGRLKPHMYATLTLGAGETRTVVVVPSPAIQTMNGKTVVFVADDTENFTPREITVGTEAEGWIEVLTGIRPGEYVATNGSFLLKSELLKATVTEE